MWSIDIQCRLPGLGRGSSSADQRDGWRGGRTGWQAGRLAFSLLAPTLEAAALGARSRDKE